MGIDKTITVCLHFSSLASYLYPENLKKWKFDLLVVLMRKSGIIKVMSLCTVGILRVYSCFDI